MNYYLKVYNRSHAKEAMTINYGNGSLPCVNKVLNVFNTDHKGQPVYHTAIKLSEHCLTNNCSYMCNASHD